MTEDSRAAGAAPHRVLVIANKTCPCPTLHEEVRRHAEGRDSEVLIVAPALNRRLKHLVSDTDEAVTQANERLASAVESLRERGIHARGKVGDARPDQAIADALHEFPADEIIISTHPPEQSHWLEKGLVEIAETRFGPPVTHVVSHYGLPQSEVAP